MMWRYSFVKKTQFFSTHLLLPKNGAFSCWCAKMYFFPFVGRLKKLLLFSWRKEWVFCSRRAKKFLQRVLKIMQKWKVNKSWHEMKGNFLKILTNANLKILIFLLKFSLDKGEKNLATCITTWNKAYHVVKMWL